MKRSLIVPWLLAIQYVAASCGAPPHKPGPSAQPQEWAQAPTPLPGALLTDKPLPTREEWFERLLTQRGDVDLQTAMVVLASDNLGERQSSSSIGDFLLPMISRVQAELKPGAAPARKVQLLNELVLPGLQRGLRGELKWIAEGLGSERGDCVPLSLLYLIAAEKVGLPLDLVQAPRHVFLSYDSGAGRRNIEETELGQHLSIDEYRMRICAPDKDSLDCFPENPDALERYLHPLSRPQMVTLLLCQNKGRSLIENCEAAAQLTPESYLPLFKMAKLHGDSADWRRQEEVLTRAIELADYVPVLYAQRSLNQAVQGKTAEALKDADAALRLSPRYGIYHQLKCAALLVGKRYDEALVEGNEAVRLAPKASDCWKWRAGVLEALKRHPEAAADMTRAIELDPRNPDLYLKRSRIWAMIGDEGKWDADRKKAKQLESGGKD